MEKLLQLTRDKARREVMGKEMREREENRKIEQK
jgi:hypothetical protein